MVHLSLPKVSMKTLYPVNYIHLYLQKMQQINNKYLNIGKKKGNTHNIAVKHNENCTCNINVRCI